MTDPRVGEPRIYAGAQVPILYPGETAHATVSEAAITEAMARGDAWVPVEGWMVEPLPGWRGRFLRARFRILRALGIRGAAARLNVSVDRQVQRPTR